jgi:hypothetical protein
MALGLAWAAQAAGFMARVTGSGTPAAGSGSPRPGGVAAGGGGQSSCRREGQRQGSLLLLRSPPSLTTQHLCTAGRSCRGQAFAARGVLLGATEAVAGPGGQGGQRRRRLRGRWVRGRIWRSRAGAAPAMVGMLLVAARGGRQRRQRVPVPTMVVSDGHDVRQCYASGGRAWSGSTICSDGGGGGRRSCAAAAGSRRSCAAADASMPL